MTDPKITVEAALAGIPANYRLYTIDASIEGRVRVDLALQRQDRDDWFDHGEVLDATGRDVRPALYVSGVAITLPFAIIRAIKECSP